MGELDLHLFREGAHTRLHQRFGGRLYDGGARFVVWAPNARAVSVIGDFNGWRLDAHPAFTAAQAEAGVGLASRGGITVRSS